MTPRLIAVAVFALGVLTLIAIRLLATRADRRRVARSVALAAGIADEHKAGWWFEDRTEDEVLAVDPPVVPPYVSVDPTGPGWYRVDGGIAYADGDREDVHRVVWAPHPEAAVQAATERFTAEISGRHQEVWTTVGGYRVHTACAEQHERREPVTDGCAEFLVHSGGTS